jgi:hypothetical protein
MTETNQSSGLLRVQNTKTFLGGLNKITLWVNGENRGVLKNGELLELPVPIGTYSIKVDNHGKASSDIVEIFLNQGQVVYLAATFNSRRIHHKSLQNLQFSAIGYIPIPWMGYMLKSLAWQSYYCVFFVYVILLWRVIHTLNPEPENGKLHLIPCPINELPTFKKHQRASTIEWMYISIPYIVNYLQPVWLYQGYTYGLIGTVWCLGLYLLYTRIYKDTTY